MFFPAELRASVVARDTAALERLITEGNDITKQAWAKVALGYVTKEKFERRELEKEAIPGPYTQLEEVTALDPNNPAANQPVILAASLVKLQLALLRPNILPKAITEKLNICTGLNELKDKTMPGPMLHEINFCLAQIYFEGGYTIKADIQKAMPIFESLLEVNDLPAHLKTKLQAYINAFQREQEKQKFWLTHKVPGSMPAPHKPAAVGAVSAQPVLPKQPMQPIIHPGQATVQRAQALQQQYAALGLIPVRSAVQPQPAASSPVVARAAVPQLQQTASMSPPVPRPAAAAPASNQDEVIDPLMATSKKGMELTYLSTAKKPAAGKKEKTRNRVELETGAPLPSNSYTSISSQIPPMPPVVLAKPAAPTAPKQPVLPAAAAPASNGPAVPSSPFSGLSALTLAAERDAISEGSMETDEPKERGVKYAKR